MTDVDDRARAALDLAQHLAALMPGWHPIAPGERYWTAAIRRADGATVTITVDDHRAKGRITFRPTWPEYSDRRSYSSPARPCGHPKSLPTSLACTDCNHHAWGTWPITVASSRAPAAMVRELERRLLPDYLPAFAEAVAEIARTEGYTDEAEMVACRLAGIVDGELRRRSYRTGERAEISTPTRAIHRLEVHPEYEGSHGGSPVRVDFQVHGLDPETAARVLEIIQEAERAEVYGAVRVVAEPTPEPDTNAEPAEDTEDRPRGPTARKMLSTVSNC